MPLFEVPYVVHFVPLVACRMQVFTVQYRVKWTGYASDKNMWDPQMNLEKVTETIDNSIWRTLATRWSCRRCKNNVGACERNKNVMTRIALWTSTREAVFGSRQPTCPFGGIKNLSERVGHCEHR